jgi:hypothetical protein
MGKHKHYFYPMKICQPSDFESKGYVMTGSFSDSLKNRLCPDIPDDVKNYYIKNLY